MAKALTTDILGQYEQFLLYGEPKTGKTLTALTAPEPIYVLCVGPANELKTRWSKAYMDRYPGERAIFFDEAVEDYGKMGEITDNPVGYDRAMEFLEKLFMSVKKGDREWSNGAYDRPETIIVDNATVFSEYQMNKAIAAGYDLANVKANTAMARLRDYGIVKPADSDWGAAQSLMTKFISFTFTQPFHFVFIAHEYKEQKAKAGNNREREEVGVYPLFIGQQRTQIARAFDNVWRHSVVGGGRTAAYQAQTDGDDIVVAGTRVGGVLPQFYQNPDLTRVIEKFKEYPKSLDSKVNKQNVRASVSNVRQGA